MIKGLQYANDVVSGKIVACQWVKLACQRFIDDLNSPDYYFDELKYKTVTRFSETLKHYSSGAVGKPFILEPWEDFIISNIFCLYRTDNHKRKYKSAHISVARKNGKTALAAMISLFGLIADGEAASSILLCANSREQAHIDFDMASVFARQLDPKGKALKILRNEILFRRNNASLKVISADSSTADGYSPSLCVHDELHEAPDSKMFDVLKSGQGFRQQPLMLSVTTAGFHLDGFCHQYEDYCKEVLSGTKQDDTLFALLYTLDDGDDWTDEKNWIKSSPNLGITVNTDWLREQVNQAKNSPALETGIRTKNLNQWMSSANVWIPEDILQKSIEPMELDDFKDRKDLICYLGWDLAAVSDLTCLTFMFVDPEAEQYWFINKYYLPKSALDGKFNSQLYDMWAKKGYLILTDSPTTDYAFIQNEILYWWEIFNIYAIGYDAWNSQYLVNNLMKEGLPLRAFSQSIGSMNRPCKEFERLMWAGKIKIQKNPINRWCINNAELKIDINGNAKVMGSHNENKVDGVVSMHTALGTYLNDAFSNCGEAFVIPLN